MIIRQNAYPLKVFLISAFFLLCFFALFTPALASNDVSITFRNDTDATIRVDPLLKPVKELASSAIIAPRSILTIVVPAGIQKFDLVAYRANPERIHTIIVNILPDHTNAFHIIPHIMGVYILEDADLLSSLASQTLNTPERVKKEPKASDIAKTCSRSMGNNGSGYVLWSEKEDIEPQYYEGIGDLLCATNGNEVYRIGSIIEFYQCAKNWQQCSRNTEHDAARSSPLRTANFDDLAMLMAKNHHPGTVFAETETLVWLNKSRPPARLTNYIYFVTNIEKPKCPEGYRFHYQGMCINVEDELADDPKRGVRMVDPVSTQ